MTTQRIFCGLAMIASGICAPLFAHSETTPVPGIVTAHEGVTAATHGDSGTTVSLWSPYVSYVVPPQANDGDARLRAILKRAADNGRAVDLQFDGTHGRIDRGAERVAFPLCRISVETLVFEPTPRCNPAPKRPDATGDTALAFGMAALVGGDVSRALELLGRAGVSDDAIVQTLLLRARADSEASIAGDAEPWSDAADQLNVKALRDYRALVAYAPADMDAQISIGTVLEELGAYNLARAHYERLLELHPDEEYRLRVRIGAVYRQEGDLKRALDQLDRIAASEGGEPNGMKYHYHCGWTLNRLGRFDEAIADFTKGIAIQPDYAWAQLRRACAYASVGRLKEALADTETFVTQMASLPGAPLSRSVRFDVDRAKAATVELKRAIAKGDAQRLPDICKGFWGHVDESRAPSRFLPDN